ncbi:hypothetical protein J27TS8_06710 [Robertmurraya siralis]|uniref:DUF309 domain-containing protein n=1 Tax=Robertmurraya siralis TaxID=77777 RepID=A0A920BS61_9BACI|nr:DUF309 domain-containing protein [Robertmurraya siralis]PAE22045.1 hypothetical protein CHH80_02715 [Bacillus sp. 7504-2]GIN60678.1 hypothetical protein J27TS8_06710 [Robertmurraya siralis]
MYPQEYIEFLVHFHGDRDYFECHEILEEYWKKVDKNNKNSVLVGLILLAVSNYHHRRGNFSGAARTLKKSLMIIEQHNLDALGLSKEELLILLKARLTHIQERKEYLSMRLPIKDSSLIEACKKSCQQKGVNWCEKSDLSNDEIVHRHLLRDRSEVMIERAQAIKLRQKKGSE